MSTSGAKAKKTLQVWVGSGKAAAREDGSAATTLLPPSPATWGPKAGAASCRKASPPPNELATDPLHAATHSSMQDQSFLLSLKKMPICLFILNGFICPCFVCPLSTSSTTPCFASIVTVALPLSLHLLATSHLVTCSSTLSR